MQSKITSWILQTLVLLQWISSHQTLNVQLDNTNLLRHQQSIRSSSNKDGDSNYSNSNNNDNRIENIRRSYNYNQHNNFRLNKRNYNSLRRHQHSRRQARDLINHIKFKVMPHGHGGNGHDHSHVVVHGHGGGHGHSGGHGHGHEEELFSPWTAWGKCDKKCYQTREKYCQNKHRCGGIKHFEQRSCSKHTCHEHHQEQHNSHSSESSEEQHHHHHSKKKKKKHHHYEEEEEEEEYHRPKKHYSHVPEHHEHHIHYDQKSVAPQVIPQVVQHVAAPAPQIAHIPFPVYQPAPPPPPPPQYYHHHEPAPAYSHPAPLVYHHHGEHEHEKQFVVVKQNVVRKFPKRKHKKPIVIQLDDYDGGGHSHGGGGPSYEDYDDDGNVLLKVLRQGGHGGGGGGGWKRLGTNPYRRIIGNEIEKGVQAEVLRMVAKPKPTQHVSVHNVSTSSTNDLLKILAASTFDYPHSSREYYSTSTDSLLGQQSDTPPLNLVAALPEPNSAWQPFTISRGPAAAMAAQPFDFFKRIPDATSPTPFDLFAATAFKAKQDSSSIMPLGVSDPPFIPSMAFENNFLDYSPAAKQSDKPSGFDFLESFHKDLAPTSGALVPSQWPTRRAEGNLTFALDDLLNEYDTQDHATLVQRGKREIRDDKNTTKKLPNSSMLKIGQPAKQRGKEKAVFEMPRKQEIMYSKWSKWSKCTAKCTTRRFKKCRTRTLCGNDVIREVAYCYTEGSFCQEWINQQMYNNYPPAPAPSANTLKPQKPGKINRRVDQTTNAIQSNTISNTISRRGALLPEYTPKNFECGIPTVRGRNSKQAPWNMLRIIGGKTARRGQWPWQVMILNRFKEPFCGGTLISPLWILTAAHCVRKRLYVRIGEHNLQATEGSELEFRIQLSIKHPKYDKKTVDSDVAMLRLPKQVEKTNFINFACLPPRYQQLPIGKICTIIGWGKRRHSDDAGTNLLHEAEVPIISNEECKNVYYDYTITKNMFCAGHKKGRVDTCAGDSGGPLLCKDSTKPSEPWTIYGITSFGDGCGKKNKFGIYAKLANYVDWIWSVVNCDGACHT